MNNQLLKQAAAATLSALLAFPMPLWAQAAAKSTAVESLEVSEDKVVITLNEEAQYKSFVTANPPRLIVEIVGAEYQAGAKSFPGKGTVLKGVRGAQFKGKPDPVSRIVLDLDHATTYTVNPVGNTLVVSLTASAAKDSGSAPASAVTQAEGAPKAPASPSPAAAEKPAAKPAEKAVARPKVVAPKAAAPAPTPAAQPGSFTTENNPELAAAAASKDVAREAAPETAAAAPEAPRRQSQSASRGGGDIMSRLTTEPVSLDFDNTDIRDIIKLLATKANINIIYGADVTGTLSLHLNEVPFNEAFRTILTMMGLQTMQVGDKVLRVLTPAAYAKAQTAQATATRVIPLNYAAATDILVTLNAIRAAEGRTSGIALADAKTNSVILSESVEGLLSTERLIASLDVRPKQVLIEAKLVEVGLNNSLHYGIQWDATHVDQGKVGGQQGTNVIGTTAGQAAGAVNASNPSAAPFDGNAASPAALAGQGLGAAARGTGVNLAATQIFGAMTLGRITNNYFVNATLTAAAAQGKVKVLSDPKIATVNNVPANINVTTSIPYVTSNVASTGVQTQTVSYAVTGIQMSVTPTINADGRITLKINPTVSQPSATAAASVATGAPAIDSRTANTTVVVKDGETIVIGGLISDSVSNQIAKIPILGDIPILGWLFKKKSVVRNRAELLIFVTPKIIQD